MTFSRFPLFALCSLLALAPPLACNDNDIVTGESIVIDEPGCVEPPSSEQFGCPVATLGALPSYLEDALSQRIASAEGTPRLVLVAQAQLASHEAEVLAVYEAGGVVAVVQPDDEALAAWCEENGVWYAGNAGESDGVRDEHLIYAFTKHLDYYFLDPMPEDADANHCNKTLDAFTHWVNDCLTHAHSMPQARAGRADIANEAYDAQQIHHTFQLALIDKNLGHVIGSKPDKTPDPMRSTLDVAYSVLPLYAFENSSNASGDYYLVRASFTIHSAGMYYGKWHKYHGGVKSNLCAYYLDHFDISHTLGRESGNIFTPLLASDVFFPEGGTPLPETTINSTTYSNGFSFTWGMGVSLGTITGAQGQIAPSWQCNDEQSYAISDLNITANSPNAVVSHTFQVRNLPPNKNKDGGYNIPNIACKDLAGHISWIWCLPHVKDGSTEEYTLQVRIDPVYASYHWYTSGADFKKNTWSAATYPVTTIKLTPPNRAPRGILTLTNTDAQHPRMGNIRLWREGQSLSEAPAYHFTELYEGGEPATLTLPTGRYRVELELSRAGQAPLKVHSAGSVEIKLAQTKTLNAALLDPGAIE